MKPNYIVAIDPDCDKSGVAFLEVASKRLNVNSMTFPLLLDFFIETRRMCQESGKTVVVYVEAGWMNASNWHVGKRDNRRVASAKGNSVGRNHETSRKIAEMCRHYGLSVEEVKPLKKCWNSKEGKITHDEIAQFVPGLPKRTNQEERDAALICWYYAGFPIIVKPTKKMVKKV